MQQMYFSLTVTSGPGVPTSFVLSNESPISFGRLESNDYVLAGDAAISREHFQISFDSDKCWIKDLDSRNGTYLNNRSILTSELNAGDEIRAGSTIMVVKLSESNNRPPVPARSQPTPTSRVAVQFEDELATVAIDRVLHTMKIHRDLIFDDAFTKYFFDLPGKAMLVNSENARANVDRSFDFESVGEQGVVIFPSSLDAIGKIRDTYFGSDSMVILNHVCRRSQLLSLLTDSFSKFKKPTTLIAEFEQLPIEISNGLLAGIDLVVCETRDGESVSVVHESLHANWLDKLAGLLDRGGKSHN